MYFLQKVYQWVGDDGEHVAIDAGNLRLWCLANRASLEVKHVPVEMRIAFDFVDKNNSINADRLWTLTSKERMEPLIYCGGAGDIPDLLVDGHHRYCRAALDHWESISAWLLTEAQWRPFRLKDLPTIGNQIAAKGGEPEMSEESLQG